MKHYGLTLTLLCSVTSYSQAVLSPAKTHRLQFTLTSAGEPQYQLSFKGKEVIKPSKLGFELLNGTSLRGGFTITKIDSTASDSSWDPIWGEVKTIRNNYKELAA